MPQMELTVLVLALAASILVLVLNRSLLDALIEGIHNFRGGPPTAMHPSPVNDGLLLRKRFRKRKEEARHPAL